MQDIDTIPLLLQVNNVRVLAKLVKIVKDSLTILSLEGISAQEDERKFCLSQSLREWVSSISDLLESGGSVAEVGILVTEIGG